MALDAVVVGAGPNGLAAALVLARAGRSVVVLEGTDRPGGGARSAELTLPGFWHDTCSGVHPLAAASPFFLDAGLERFGLELAHPEVPLAHPLDGGRAGVLHRDAHGTAQGLGPDADRWHRIVGWVAERWDQLAPALLGPLLRVPEHPLVLAGFGLRGAPPAVALATLLRTAEARGLLAGAAAHSFLSLRHPFTSAMGLMLLASGHVAGWPVARGGSQAITDALLAALADAGGTVEVDRPVRCLADVPEARAVLFDVTPAQLVAIAGDELPASYRRRLGRYRRGPAAFKVDFALSEPVPWTNELCRRAGTLHLGGTVEEIAAAEGAVARGRVPARPFVLVSQPSLFDDRRAPAGRHTLWTYCHVPNGCDVDMTEALEDQIERFAPGFRDVVLARHVAPPGWFEARNANFAGGDISAGAHDGLQMVMRPVVAVHPHRTPNPRLFLCGASTPPGAGVHGMCGLHAAEAALATALA